ncbi:hypothetical protein EDD22DRAFT_1021818 [Suillus occidentalis]|nr:hypothetical protein EDD22DRAFT_1021818 [Suillus occidentalis]
MVDLTPSAGVDTSLTVYDHNQRAQAGNILYDLLRQTRTSILECLGLLEAIALAIFLTPLAPDPNTPSCGSACLTCQYLWTAHLVIRCSDLTRRSAYGYTSPPDENAVTTVIHLNQNLVATWSRIKAGNFLDYQYIRGQKVEAGYWVGGWFSQSGLAYFLYNRQPLDFDPMCAMHFVNNTDRTILKPLGSGSHSLEIFVDILPWNSFGFMGTDQTAAARNVLA